MATTLDTMFAELKNSPSTLLPSNFWLAITDEHLKMLEDFGIENLRQTIAHKHFTFGYDGDSKRKAQSKLTKLTSLKCKLKSHTQAKQIQRHKHIYTSHLQNIPVHMEYKSLKRHCYYTNLLYAFFKRVYSEELLNAVSESPVGNPYPIYEKGKLLSEDMINSLIEYSMMKKYVPLSECQQVIEIGAGYGRMAAIFGQLHRECKYVIADIPPTLYVSQSYLSRRFPDKKIFKFRPFSSFEEIESEWKEADICFLLPHQLLMLPSKSCDLLINISSFHEMKMEQIKHYFSEVNRLVSGHFYTKQWKKSYLVLDRTMIFQEDYPVYEEWQELYTGECDLQNRFFESIYKI